MFDIGNNIIHFSRLFFLYKFVPFADHCSKSAIGSYSPELSQQRNWSGTEQHEAEGGNEYGEEESDEDSRADEIAVENSVNRILQIVDSSVKKRLAGQAGRKTASVSTSSASAGVLTPSSAGPGQEEGEQEEANFADEDYGTDLAANADQDDAEWTREGSSNGGGIRDMVVARVLSILHTGTYKEASCCALFLCSVYVALYQCI